MEKLLYSTFPLQVRGFEPASENTVDLDSMTKAQLLEYAEANGIEGVSSSMLKADILAAIKEAA